MNHKGVSSVVDCQPKLASVSFIQSSRVHACLSLVPSVACAWPMEV